MLISDWRSYACSSYLCEIFPSAIGPATVSPLYFQPAGIFQYPGYAFFVFRRGMDRQQDARRASFMQLCIDGFLQTAVWPRLSQHIHGPHQRANLGSCACSGHNNKERSEEQTSELQSLMCISYAVICLKKKT